MLNTLSSSAMLPKDKFINPFMRVIKALAVAKNGRPKITGICLHSLAIGSVSRTIKSTGYMNLSTYTNTSSIIPFRTLIDLSASKRVVEVGLNSPRLSCTLSKEAN